MNLKDYAKKYYRIVYPYIKDGVVRLYCERCLADRPEGWESSSSGGFADHCFKCSPKADV